MMYNHNMLTDEFLKTQQFSFRHPGGDQNLKNVSRLEKPSVLFYSYHLGKDLTKIKKYMPGGDKLVFDDLFVKLNDIYVKHTNSHKLVNMLYEIYNIIHGLLVLPFCLLMFILYPLNPIVSLCLAFSMVYYSFNVFHMRHHRGTMYLPKTIYDNYVSKFLTVIERTYFINPINWNTSHNLSHHVDTNQSNDWDIITPYPMFRISPTQKHMLHHYLQRYYVLPLLSMNGFSFPFYNLFYFGFDPSSLGYFMMHYLTLLIIPAYINGYSYLSVFMMFFITIATAGLIISLMFQVSHNDVKNHVEKDGFVDFRSWVKLQVHESINWGGLLGVILFGGINYQIDHHIAPAVSPLILYYASNDVEKLINTEFGISFIRHATFFDSVRSYLAHITKMGRRVNL